MDKRRHFSRVPFEFNSTIAVDRKKFNATIIDISLKGALITKPQSWEQGNRHRLLLEVKLLNPDMVMHIHAEVTHEREDALGLRFVEIDMESISHLRRLMELNTGDASLIDREVTALHYSVNDGKQLP